MHTTIARFRTLHFAPCAEQVMAGAPEFLYKSGEISGEAVFIDGTKIEADANKYTFVWAHPLFYVRLECVLFLSLNRMFGRRGNMLWRQTK